MLCMVHLGAFNQFFGREREPDPNTHVGMNDQLQWVELVSSFKSAMTWVFFFNSAE